MIRCRIPRPVTAAMLAGLVLAGCGGAAPAASPSGAAASAKPASSAAARPPSAQATAPPSAAGQASASAPAGQASASAAPAAAPSGGMPLTLGYAQVTSAFAPLYITQEGGFFSRNGLTVDIKQVNGPAQVPALLAGEIQVAMMGGNELLHAGMGGAPVVGLGTLADVPIFKLYADKKYHTVQDLAGQSVGVTALGTTTEATAKLFLKHFNMLDKVKIVGTGGTSAGIMAALTKGAVAAAILNPESAATAAKQGYVELVNGITLGVPYNFDTITVTRPYLKDHADEVRRFLRAYRQAWTYLGDPSHRQEVIKATAKYTRSSEEMTAVGYDAIFPVWSSQKVPTVNPEALANILAVSNDAGAQSVEPGQLIDNSIIESVSP